MSFLNDKTKFAVKTSNLSTVAKFSSTLDDAYFLILANNSNYIQYGCNQHAAVFGASSTSNFEAYIGLVNNNMVDKLARFNNYDIQLNRNLVVTGNIVPTSNVKYDLGSPEYKWRDLYLSGNSIYVGETILSSDPETGSLSIKNSSNEIAPMVAAKLKLVSSGTSSNYSVFTSTDYGINLTFYDKDDNEINHLDLGKGDTSMLPEGSNLYYTFERFDERLLSKTLDDIRIGTSNRYIVNDTYDRDLHITGTLFASNMVVYGDRTTLNTETYQTEQLEIVSEANAPVLIVKQLGTGNVFQVQSGSNIAMLIDSQGRMGINTSNPLYNLDIVGTAQASYFKGDASLMRNVNLADRTTSLLAEGSNLYYTSARVGIIATSSNIDTSNYIYNTSNEISTRLTDTSNLISDRLTDTSNLISNRLTDTSNLISNRLTDTSNLISNRLTDTSNLISNRLTDTSNLISDRITQLTTSEIAEGSNIYYTLQRFDDRLLTKTLDHIYVGTSNKYIVNDVYNSDLRVTGTFSASNLIVHGSFTTLDTITYQTKKLEIVSDSQSPALLIRQNGASNIMEVYDDSNIMFTVANDGYVGINKLHATYALDVVGTVNADYYIGDGGGLYHVYLGDRDTSMLAEGSNLYYTAERVGIISTASNLHTSNYIEFSSNTLATNLTLTSNSLIYALETASNEISTSITNLTTANIAEGVNLFYTVERFDERLRSKTADYVANGTSNKYIVNDVYDNDLTVSGTLTASNLVVTGEVSILNTNTYQTERMEIISDVAGPALKITQHSSNDLLHIYDDTNIALSIIKGGNVGVQTINPVYPLDVFGTTRSSYFIGDGASLSNVNLADRNTSMLVEGSNLYYTSERVGVIADSSNIQTSNYIFDTSNLLISKILQTSNLLTDTINNVVNVEIDNTLTYLIYTSNLLINNITTTSNILTYEINETINTEINTTIDNLNYTSNVLLSLITTTSNELTNVMNNVVNVQVGNTATNLTATSNQLITNILATSNDLTNTINNVVTIQINNASNFIVNTSNMLTTNLQNYNKIITTRLDNLSTDQIPEGSNLYYTDSRFNAMLLTKSLDDIRDGTSNRYITNDRYSGDLYVTGTLSTSNLIVNGNTTTLNTTTYQSKKLEIISDAIGPALKVQQNGIFDIMQVYDDSNLVMSIVNGGRVGINTSNPAYTFDVQGTTRATYLLGDGSGLTKVNFLDRNTSMLAEGSNLYYTSERVGIIATSSNIDTSNYILNSSNAISNRITTTSNQFDAYITSTSNTLYTNIIASSNFIAQNLNTTSNFLMKSLIDTSNLAINTSNDIMVNLTLTYNTTTSNFLVNSNLLASNILLTSNNLATLVNTTSLGITSALTDTSNTLINNINSTSNTLILNTNNTYATLMNNLGNVSNLFASNIPVIYGNFLNNVANMSNTLSIQITNNSNTLINAILNNSNILTARIVDTSNAISTRVTNISNILSTSITLTSNEYASNLTVTSNMFRTLFQQTSNSIYAYYNQTSNSLSTDIVVNSNLISKRISDLTLDMIAPGSSNTYIINNIYDANLTITGSLVVNSLDVIDLGLLEMNETGSYINTDMKTYVARITSNVLAAAPAIIMNASNNFDIYDIRQSNYIATKQDILSGAVSTITTTNLAGNRVVITNNAGKLIASTVLSSNLEQLATLTAPIQTQINNLNISSSNIALSLLDRIAFLNSTIGESTGGTGNNLSTTNIATTCNLVSFDPILHLKFEDVSDSSKYASKNYALMKIYPAYTDHTNDLILWYKFDNNLNNWIDNTDMDLYLVYGVESYVLDRSYGLNSVILNGSTSYTRGLYNSRVIPKPVNLGQNRNKGLTFSFWMNANRLFTGRQYVFSFCTSNLFITNDASVEAYISTSNLCVSISQGINALVYNVPCTILPNIDYNVAWEISSNATWKVSLNGINYSTYGIYPASTNYVYTVVGGQVATYSSNFFNGYLSDLRVYNKDLTQNELDDNTNIRYPSYDLHRNDLLLWYNFEGHLQNFDGNLNYALSVGAGTVNYVVVKNMSLYTAYFNGSTYYSMNVANGINFNTVSDIYPKGLTFSISFNASAVSTTQYLFTMSDTASSTPTRSIEVFLINNQLNFRVRQNGTTTMQTVSLSTTIVAQKFYNVTWVMTPGTSDTTASWYIYLNGVNVYTMEGDRYYAPSGTYTYNYIGSIYNTSLFTGYIDDFRVYRKSLTYDDVLNISFAYSKYGTFTDHEQNIVSWYKFDNDNRNAVIDNTIPLIFMNFKDKQILAYNTTDLYQLYNGSSNVVVYPNIDAYTSSNADITGYNPANAYALNTAYNRYIIVSDKTSVANVVSIINKYGFVLHFVFKTQKLSNVPVFYIGNSSKSYVNVLIYYTKIVLILNSEGYQIDVRSANSIAENTWYTVDFVCKVDKGRVYFELYINKIKQDIIGRYTNILSASSNLQVYDYKGLTYIDDNNVIYLGAYNPKIQYNTSNYIGAVVTATYYSSNIQYYDYAGVSNLFKTPASIPNILVSSPSSSSVFNSYVNDANNNKLYAFTNSILLTSNDLMNNQYYVNNSNNFITNSININDLQSVYLKTLANIYLESGFYHFAIDLQNDISYELVISGINNINMTNEITVASYYNGSLDTPASTINNCMVLQYPIKLLDGYYKISLKTLRKASNNSSFLTAKYYKYTSYTGSNYTIFDNISYVNFSTLTDDIKNNMSTFNNKLLVNNNIVYKPVSTNPIVAGSNSGIMTLGGSTEFNLYGIASGNPSGTLQNLTNIPSSNLVVKMYASIYYADMYGHNMFLLDDGNIYFTGQGDTRLNLTTSSATFVFMKMSNLPDKVIDISGGYVNDSGYSLFLLKTGGKVYYSRNSYYGSPGYIRDSTNTADITNIIKITTRHVDSIVYMIDKNYNVLQAPLAVPISSYVLGNNGSILNNVKDIAGGSQFVLFLTHTNEVYALGDNTYGQLGLGHNNNVTVATQMKGLNGNGFVNNIIKISAGNIFSLLLTADSGVYATGYNTGGVLGIGTTVNTNVLMEIMNIDGNGALKGIKDLAACRHTKINGVPTYPLILLGQDNNIYIKNAAYLKLLNSTQSVNKKIYSVATSGVWIYLNTVRYDITPPFAENTFAKQIDENASSNLYAYDSNFQVMLQDVRLYTPEIMGTSNVIINQLDNGVYTPSTVSGVNNLINMTNVSYDFSNYYKGVSSAKFTDNSYAYFPANFYNFGASDTTISMWIDADNKTLKYPMLTFTSNYTNTYCISSATSNMDTWKCFDNSSNTSLSLAGFTTIYSIGYNNVGQLGDNSTTNRTAGYVPVLNSIGLDSTIIQIAGTSSDTGWYVHFLTDTGKVYYLLSTGLNIIDPNNFAGERITMIASGRSTYFITESGLLYAYGNNSYYQLGNGNSINLNIPTLIPASRWNGEKVVYVATGRYHTYIITVSGAIFTIGYNSNGQLGTGNTTNQTSWTLFTALFNVSKIYCSGDQTYLITNAGLLYSTGVRGNVPYLENSIPSTKRIIKISFSPGNCAFALADDGTVYGYGNNPISMPNTTSAQTNFIQITSTVWGTLRIVDVVTAGDHTFYTLENGQVYVVGNNNYGQLNIPTTTANSKTPILVNVGGAKINMVYGGLFTTGYNLVICYPPTTFTEFGRAKGEYVKFDVLDSIAINYANISLTTPASTTSLMYLINLKLYGTNSANALNNFNVLWDFIGSYDTSLAYSASAQTVSIASSSANAYRYYAVVINSRYNINLNEISLYVNGSITSKKTIFDACINEGNYLNISLQSSNITASVAVNNSVNSITVSHPNIYTTGILYGLTIKFNTDPYDATWSVYTNGILAKTIQPMMYPITGSYSNVMLGKSVYSVNGLNYYYTGNIDDFRIYNRALTMAEMSSIYTSVKYNIEGYTSDNYINRYALVSSRDMYMYNANYGDITGLLRNLDANGFTIHFVFKTNNISRQPLYNVSGRLLISVIGGVLSVSVGKAITLISRNLIVKNSWYIVDLIGTNIGTGNIALQLYLNNVLQPIYVNNVYYTVSTVTYTSNLMPDNIPSMNMYIGNYSNVYRDNSEIVAGALFTNTYYSCNLIINNSNTLPALLTRCALNSIDFHSMISAAELYYSYKTTSNVELKGYIGSNFVFDNYLGSNINRTSFILNEIDTNIKLTEGYYYFACDIDSTDVSAQLYIGIDNLRNVAHYYSSNFVHTDNILSDGCRTTSLPVYIPDGYYKFHSKTYSKIDRKSLHHKYIKLATGYTGDYFTLLGPTMTHQAYNLVDVGLRAGALGVEGNTYIIQNSSTYVGLKTGGYIDSLMYGLGDNRVSVFDNGLIIRANNDSVSTTYVNRLNTSNEIGAQLLNWSFYTSQSGRSITPLILENTSGTNYTVRAIGTTQNVVGTGIYTFNFGLVSGSNIFATSNYYFGWKDNNAGVINSDSTNSVAQTTYALTGNATTSMVLGTSYDFANALGNKTYAFRLEFGIYSSTRPEYMRGISSVANGASHTVILRFDGSSYSCGDNTFGQLGLNTTTRATVFTPVLDVISGNLTGVQSISCGSYWSHFIKTDGTAYGCGMNTYGNLGDNSTTQRNRIVQVLGVGGTGVLSGVQQIAGGFGHNFVTLFLKTDGTVYGCGNNTLGTIGDNTTIQRNAPVQVLGVGGVGVLTSVKQVCTNSTTSVFLMLDGTVYACGGNSHGQVGDLSSTQRNTVVQIIGIGGQGYMNSVTQIAANGGSKHTLFLRGDGMVYACGFNGTGQLGTSNLLNFPYPMRVMNAENNGAMNGITQIANTANSSYFLKYDGSLLSCGSDDLGQLGNGLLNSNYLIPTYVLDKTGSIMRGISQLSVGGMNTMNAIYNNGIMQNVISKNFYIMNTETDKPEVLIQDFRIYNNGNVITSNLINLNKTNNNLLLTSYSTYNEITDANRWMKSKDYYLYNNGVLNRSIYYTEGNVGIGTSAPSASLEIFTSDATLNSIKTNNPIWAQTGVLTSSDKRIKKNIVDINDLSALEQILKIEPKIYNYVDDRRGKSDVYGFIAQQVGEVIPNAVSVQSESIPNIYKKGYVQNGNIIRIDDFDVRNIGLCIGDFIDVLVKNGVKIRCEIMEVVNDSMVRVDTFFDDDEVFVYGTVVNDFHTLDKNYIYTLNVCATQDLHRQYKENEMKLEEQNKLIETLIEKLDRAGI